MAQRLRTDFKAKDPVAKFCGADDHNAVHSFIRNLKGVGLRVDVDLANQCREPRIILDGSSDEPYPEDFEPGGPTSGGGDAAYAQPFDLTVDGAGFTLAGTGAECWLWLAGASIDLADIESATLTWAAGSSTWSGSIAATSYIWIELNRAPETGENDCELFIGTTLPDGTTTKYQERAMVRPLWRLDHADAAISLAIDLRNSQHFGATA